MKKPQLCFSAGRHTSLPAMAHVTYTGRNFGTFNDTLATSTISNQVTGNYGWVKLPTHTAMLTKRWLPVHPDRADQRDAPHSKARLSHPQTLVPPQFLGAAPGFSLY
jgi:hypothetical protein